MASDVSTEDLYKCYEILYNASESVEKYQKEYESILNATSGSTSIKRLAPSILVKFVQNFPSLRTKTLHCICDLLEDADASIRLAAIKCLPEYAAACPKEASKVADVLAQMLATEDTVELAAVKRSLLSIMKSNTKESLSGIFSQMASTEDHKLRTKTVLFVANVIDTLNNEVFGRLQEENERHVMKVIEQVLRNVTVAEHQGLMDILCHLHLCTTAKGTQEVVTLLAGVAGLETDFEHNNTSGIPRVIECTKEAIVWSQRGANPVDFYSYFIHKVLPDIAQVPEEPQHELLRLLTALVTFDLSEEVLKESAPVLQTCIQAYLPLPADSGQIPKEENYQFSIVECLLYAFHSVVQRVPEYLASKEGTLKELRSRLTYFSRGCQLYHSQLQKELAGKTDKELLDQANKIKLQAKQAIDNISTMIRDFFHNPPSCKTAIKLSFVRANPYDKKSRSKLIYTGRPFTGPTPTPISPGFNRKRSAESKTGVPPDKVAKDGKSQITKIIYEPPRGTYSSKLSGSDSNWSDSGQKVTSGWRGQGRGWRTSFAGTGGRGRGKRGYRGRPWRGAGFT